MSAELRPCWSCSPQLQRLLTLTGSGYGTWRGKPIEPGVEYLVCHACYRAMLDFSREYEQLLSHRPGYST